MNVNTSGADWLIIRRWASDEIDNARDHLEGILNPEATTFERGKIAALRAMLTNFEPQITPQVEDVNYG